MDVLSYFTCTTVYITVLFVSVRLEFPSLGDLLLVILTCSLGYAVLTTSVCYYIYVICDIQLSNGLIEDVHYSTLLLLYMTSLWSVVGLSSLTLTGSLTV